VVKKKGCGGGEGEVGKDVVVVEGEEVKGRGGGGYGVVGDRGRKGEEGEAGVSGRKYGTEKRR